MAKETKRTEKGNRWRVWLWVLCASLAGVSVSGSGNRVRHYVTTDAQFTMSRDGLELQGLVYTSRAKVLRIFANDFHRSVFAIPLAERRRRLLAIDWVEEASVSRIWPDRLVVRIRER